MQTTAPRAGDTVALAEYPGALFEVVGFEQNGGLVVTPVTGSGLVTNVAGMVASPAPAPAGAPAPKAGDDADYARLAKIAVARDEAARAYTTALNFITQLGHDQGQLDLWMSLGVGQRIPPGYGDGFISYEMLTAQRDNWRLARDRSLENLVQIGYVFLGKLVAAFAALGDYLIDSPAPDKVVATQYRNELAPMARAADEIGKVAGTRLAEVLAVYREQVKRVDFGLNKLNIAPLKVPEGAGWGLLALAAIAAAAFGFAAGK